MTAALSPLPTQTPETWPGFARQYRKQITGVARVIYARWMTPNGVAREDVEQEVWLGAWLAWQRYEPNRGGMSRAAYALCSGRLDAQRWVHVQRNALRRSGAEKMGRWPIAIPPPDEAETEAEGSGARRKVHPYDRVIEPGQEAVVAFHEAVREALRACRDVDRRVREAAIEAALKRAYEENMR